MNKVYLFQLIIELILSYIYKPSSKLHINLENLCPIKHVSIKVVWIIKPFKKFFFVGQNDENCIPLWLCQGQDNMVGFVSVTFG